MTALPHTQQNNPAPPARPEVQRRSPPTASSDAANPERKSRAEPFREESSLFDALLTLTKTEVDNAQVAEKIAGEARDDTPQALDAVWEEEQVKFFAEQGCGDSDITAHQRRFAGAVAPQYLNISTGGER